MWVFSPFSIFFQHSQVSVSGARRCFIRVKASHFDHQVCIQWQQKKVWIQSKNYGKLIWIIEYSFKGLFKRWGCAGFRQISKLVPDDGSLPMIYGSSSSNPSPTKLLKNDCYKDKSHVWKCLYCDSFEIKLSNSYFRC